MDVQGDRALSLRELGRQLGVSHTSAQRHFADRRALLDAVAARGFDHLGGVLAEAAADRGGDFQARLVRLAQAHIGFALQRPALFKWMFEAASWSDAPASLRAASHRALSHAGVIIRDGQDAGEVVAGDPEHLGLASFAAVQGLVSMSVGGRFSGRPLDELAPGVIERIILGLRPR